MVADAEPVTKAGLDWNCSSKSQETGDEIFELLRLLEGTMRRQVDGSERADPELPFPFNSHSCILPRTASAVARWSFSLWWPKKNRTMWPMTSTSRNADPRLLHEHRRSGGRHETTLEKPRTIGVRWIWGNTERWWHAVSDSTPMSPVDGGGLQGVQSRQAWRHCWPAASKIDLCMRVYDSPP